MLELVQVDKTFSPGTPGETKVFEGFSLTVPEGQFLSIVGGNGSGKTTLLNILCGSVPIDRGEVRIEGRNVEKMQDYRLAENGISGFDGAVRKSIGNALHGFDWASLGNKRLGEASRFL